MGWEKCNTCNSDVYTDKDCCVWISNHSDFDLLFKTKILSNCCLSDVTFGEVDGKIIVTCNECRKEILRKEK